MKIYYSSPYEILSVVTANFQPKSISEGLLKNEMERLILEAVLQGNNPIETAHDLLYLPGYPLNIGELLDQVMQTLEMGSLLFEMDGLEVVELTDKYLLKNYNQMTFYEYLIELTNYFESK